MAWQALCTEAALNAVQRRYPQIYKSSERLLVDPKTIEVQPRDFMVSVKSELMSRFVQLLGSDYSHLIELIPSSARSTSTHATPLPLHLKPLLQPALDSITGALEKTLPSVTKRSTLEEAEWEYEDQDGGWEREMVSQGMDKIVDSGRVTNIVCSNGNPSGASTADIATWPCWYGTCPSGRCRIALSRGLSCAEYGFGHVGRRLDSRE